MCIRDSTEAAGSKYDVLEDSCEAWKIEWNSETGYVEKSVPLLANIDADFVRVSCRMRRRGTVDDGGDVDLDRTTPELRPRRSGSVERHQTPTSLMTAERRARQIHREQLRRFSPRLVGAVGLPDPLGNVPAERQTSSTDAAEKHAVAQNELRSRSDEQTLAESTTVNQGEISENREPRRGRKLEGIVDAESSLEHDWGDEGEDADSASTEVYEQWIAHIHPLRDVADRRERNHRSSGLNVLVLALESVSSISFDRVLPKSHQFLVDQPNTALFTGYNVIGDAAPANIIPLLTGRPMICASNIRISTDDLWRVFHILTEPVPYTFVSVNRRNSEARSHISVWTEPVPFKYGKLATKSIHQYTDIFLQRYSFRCNGPCYGWCNGYRALELDLEVTGLTLAQCNYDWLNRELPAVSP